MLLNGGLLLLLLERLLVLRIPFRAGLTERDLGEIVRRALEGDRDRESIEAGVLERVRSRPLETDREGIANGRRTRVQDYAKGFVTSGFAMLSEFSVLCSGSRTDARLK